MLGDESFRICCYLHQSKLNNSLVRRAKANDMETSLAINDGKKWIVMELLIVVLSVTQGMCQDDFA